MHKAKNRPKRSHHQGQRKLIPKHCKECNWHYVLVGGKKNSTHVCPETPYVSVSEKRARGWKKNR